MPILFSNNFNEFQALVQEIKSQGMIMTAFMEESQSTLENLREIRQPRHEVASKPEREFSNKLRG